MGTYNHYYELPVYALCRTFRSKVAVIARKHFPKHEDFHLKAQILDSCRSVTANIAEGFGRFHYQGNIQFCRQSSESLAETQEHMITAYDDKYVPNDILREINKDYKERLKQLKGYIKYLKTAKPGGNNNK